MTNYQAQLDNIIKGIDVSKKPKLLLHSCCGPCSSYCIEYLAQYFDITVYFYNPNIEPEEEYYKRLETQKKLIEKLSLCVLEEGEWENSQFKKKTKGLEKEKEGGERCKSCISMRIEKTALLASQKGFDYFCTTLSVSPHKNAQTINVLGKLYQDKYNIKWLPSDFKKREGYKRSIELSRQYDLYRQDYCGCSYSKR